VFSRLGLLTGVNFQAPYSLTFYYTHFKILYATRLTKIPSGERFILFVSLLYTRSCQHTAHVHSWSACVHAC